MARRRVVSLALIGLLSLSACGGSGPGTASTDPTASGARTQPKAENGEESIEEFGEEAAGAERAKLVASFRSYIGALAGRDHARACAGLAAGALASLRQLTHLGGRRGCERALSKLLAPAASAVEAQRESARVVEVRARGGEAFIVFHAPGAKLYELAMAREAGRWRATTVLASVLVPSPAALGR